MTLDILAPLTQFGAAGIIAAAWVVERRTAASRERELSEAHERVVRQREELGVLVEAVRASERAMVSVEAGQRALVAAIDRLAASASLGRLETPAPAEASSGAASRTFGPP